MDESLKEAWGCEQPVEQPFWELDGDTYFSCPLLWVTEDVIEWYREYEYALAFGGTPWVDQTYAWVKAFQWYTQASTRYASEERAKQSQHSNSITAFSNAKLRGDEDG